jgi:type III pantothenate kinase
MAGICSVVPDAVHSLRNCFRKYFRFEPFVLQPGAKTGLKIRYRNPLEVGADKIANAIGALRRFPGRHLLIIDFGTATTVCAVTKDKEYLGGIITPGINISMVALESQTARLPAVEILRPSEVLGRFTVESMQ